MLGEFKKFLIKGNAVDMAVGFMFGAAFSSVVKSMVDNVITPPIGLILGKIDFSNLFFSLDGNSYKTLDELTTAGAPAIKYGLFINDLVGFIILGFIIFIIVRYINNLSKKEEPKTQTPKKSPEVLILEEIRDVLKK